MNDSGQVVGARNTPGDTAEHAFSWTEAGGMVDLGTLGGTRSSAVAVNASGQVVGQSTTAGDASTHAVLWRAPPATKNDCKKGGWRTYGAFKNQGDCERYVNSP